MKNRITKVTVISMVVLLLTTSAISAFAHSGRTDSSGGHNKTSDGSYHYHSGSDRTVEYKTKEAASGKTTATPKPTPTPTPAPTPVPVPIITPTLPETITATPNASTVYVDGKVVAFDAYTISSENYFKLRDVAYAANGTRVQFAMSYDGAITLTSGKAYTPDGSEMRAKGTANKTPVLNKSKIILDGKEVELTAYTIDGNNYFKLRELAQKFDFYIGYDGDTKAITVDTSIGYGIERTTQAPAATPSPEPVAETGNNLVPSGKEPKNPTSIFKLIMNSVDIIFYNAPKIIYSTTGAENGFADKYMYTTGKVKKLETVESFRIVYIETSDGTICLYNSRATDDTGDEILTKDSDWQSLEIGGTYEFFFMYNGYSSVLNAPSGAFCNANVLK